MTEKNKPIYIYISAWFKHFNSEAVQNIEINLDECNGIKNIEVTHLLDLFKVLLSLPLGSLLHL